MVKRIGTAFVLLIAGVGMACSAELTVPTKTHQYVSQQRAKDPQDKHPKASTNDSGSLQKHSDTSAT